MNAIFDLQQMMAEAMFGYAALQTALTVVVTMVVTWLWCYFSMGAVTQAERAHRQLRKDVLQSLTDLEKTLKDDGQTTRDSMSFQDIQARIQAAINKSMANGVTTEEMASRLESVHAGICKALRMLRRELVDEVEGFMQTLKQDLEGHGLGVSPQPPEGSPRRHGCPLGQAGRQSSHGHQHLRLGFTHGLLLECKSSSQRWARLCKTNSTR